MLLRKKKALWDVFLLFVIVLSLFEIPYSIGFKEVSLSSYTLNHAITFIFCIDIVFNLCSTHDQPKYGFWGWRRLFFTKPSSSKIDHHGLRYFCSGWFLIDLVSVLPFYLWGPWFEILNSSKAIRLMRMFKIIKTAKAAYILKFVMSLSESKLRLVYAVLTILFSSHIFTCLFGYVSNEKNNYLDAFDVVITALIANDLPAPENTATRFLGYLMVLFGYGFLGYFIGTLASLFEDFDRRRSVRKKDIREWSRLTSKYPGILDDDTISRIHDWLIIKNERGQDDRLISLISELDSSLESVVKSSIREYLSSNPDDDLKALAKSWES